MWNLFLYTGHGLTDFRANAPDNLIVFVEGPYTSARALFIDTIGKEPELMGYENLEGSSKETVWQKAVDSDFGLGDVELELALSVDGTLVLENNV